MDGWRSSRKVPATCLDGRVLGNVGSASLSPLSLLSPLSPLSPTCFTETPHGTRMHACWMHADPQTGWKGGEGPQGQAEGQPVAAPSEKTWTRGDGSSGEQVGGTRPE